MECLGFSGFLQNQVEKLPKEMESKQRTPSVIARLMGLDEWRPQQPVCKPHRVLSESYLRKSASIGLVEKRSYHERHSFKVNYEKGKEFSNVLEFTNHHHDLQFAQQHSQSGHETVLKSSSSPYSGKSEIPRKSERKTARRNILRSIQKLENGFVTDSYVDFGVDYTRQLLKDETRLSPSRIVVLKPNIGKAQNASRPSFSPICEEVSQQSDRKSVEFSKLKNIELHNRVVQRKNLAELRGNETSTNESKITMPPCPKLFDWKKRCQTTHPPLNRLSFAKQAKQRLLERWKMTRSLQEVGVASRGTTLGEMLSMPDKETKPIDLNYKLDACGLNNQLVLNDGDSDLGSPFSISSRDGWKEECAKSLTRSESLPAACITIEIPKSRIRNEAVHDDSSEVGVSRFSNESVLCLDLEYDQVQGTMAIQDELKNSCGENDLSGKSEEKYVFAHSPIGTVTYSSLDSEVVAVAETENVGMSSGTAEEQQSEPAACILFLKHSSHALDSSVGQDSSVRSLEESWVPSSCPRVDSEFPVSFWEGYSDSPNSVLEPPFGEENLSASNCFQDIGADLRGLRMQLQLLKSEAEETNSEGLGMVVSSDEDSGDGSVDLSEENRKLQGLFGAQESRDFSYVVDVLDEAGFYSGNPQLDFETWHSQDCPVNLSVFETLEKKYGEQTYWEKAERRLLFDRTNLGLKEILQPCRDVLTWTKPLRKMFNLSQSREVIEEELWMFLVSQEKEVSKDLSEKALGTEIRWFNVRDDIDLIVCEIERFLFDELVAELVSIESF
ncbi:unnamed protein product [Camellia sinensis]